jgi:hypothetical protein|tara:strand:+ start:82 stop:366 length:285 start_codon:yes stop_codon:yes gene_type:complete
MKTPDKNLKKAQVLVSGERGEQHGDFVDLHERVALLWSTYLETMVTAEQVAFCMTLLKVARYEVGERNEDDLVDATAYTGIWGDIILHYNENRK